MRNMAIVNLINKHEVYYSIVHIAPYKANSIRLYLHVATCQQYSGLIFEFVISRFKTLALHPSWGVLRLLQCLSTGCIGNT